MAKTKITYEDGTSEVIDTIEPTEIGGEIIKESARQMYEPYIRGLKAGLTFRPIEPSPLRGSVFEPAGERVKEFIGEAIGATPALAASSLIGGSAITPFLRSGAVGAARAGIAKGLATGVIFGGAGEIARKGIPLTPLEQLEFTSESAKTGLMFGGLSTIGAGFGGIRNLLGNKIPKDTYNSIFEVFANIPKDSPMRTYEKLDAIGDSIANTPGIFGTKKTMIYKLQSKINELEPQIQKKLEEISSEEKISKFNIIDPKKVIDDLEILKASYFVEGKPIPNAKQIIDQIESVEKEFFKDHVKIEDKKITKESGTIGIDEANTIKRKMYKLSRDEDFLKSQENLTGKVQAMRVIENSLKTQIEDNIPGIRTLNSEQGVYIAARDNLNEAYRKQLKRGNWTTIWALGTRIPIPRLTTPLDIISSSSSRGLRKGLGEPSRYIAPTISQLMRTKLGLEEMQR